ncbi:MAG: hypothetical protein J2P37_12925 [Ktedonobacteraceae bacterium]|nr:hypothetical protein [Ktedonobacteraceae bacterium]MBO0795010.1 hypothetical protein [Ktedonobacteraceae bacterium]
MSRPPTTLARLLESPPETALACLRYAPSGGKACAFGSGGLRGIACGGAREKRVGPLCSCSDHQRCWRSLLKGSVRNAASAATLRVI